MRQVILDIETTGLDPKEGHRIVEFCALEMINLQLTGKSLAFLCNPQRDIPDEVVKVHGITNEDITDKLTFQEHITDVINFISDTELIIHNAPFDIKFIDAEFARSDAGMVKEWVNSVVDTLVLAKEMYPLPQRNTLDALCDRFNINRNIRKKHGAMIDCQLLHKVYLKLLGM